MYYNYCFFVCSNLFTDCLFAFLFERTYHICRNNQTLSHSRVCSRHCFAFTGSILNCPQMFVYVHSHMRLASLHTPWCSGIDCDFIRTCPVSMAEHHQVWWITLQSVCPRHLSCRCRGTVADCIDPTHLQVLVHTSCAYMC